MLMPWLALEQLNLHNKSSDGLYQNKVNSNLAAIQRPGHWADNCKMAYHKMSFLVMKKIAQVQQNLLSKDIAESLF